MVVESNACVLTRLREYVRVLSRVQWTHGMAIETMDDRPTGVCVVLIAAIDTKYRLLSALGLL